MLNSINPAIHFNESKASFAKTETGVIVGALGFRNEYDGRSLDPITGHIKEDHRLNRNFYKGMVGDNINILCLLQQVLTSKG